MGVILHTLCTTVMAPATTTSTTSTATAPAFPGHTHNATNATTFPSTPSALNASRACHNDSAALCECDPAAIVTNSTRGMLSHEGSLDALLYIVVVLLFYAFSIVVLMVKYIRRENKEAYLRQYFDEFVAREQFQSPQARNQMCLKNIMERRGNLDFRGQVNLDLNPVASVATEMKLVEAHQDYGPSPLNIPETINEVVEGRDGEEEMAACAAAQIAEGESLEEELVQSQTECVETECETLEDAGVGELLPPRRETPV